MKLTANALTVGKYSLVNSLWCDGSVFVADDTTQRIVYLWTPPDWFVTAYNWLLRN